MITFLQIVKPKPVPQNRRAVLESAWLKGLNNRCRTSSSIPIPVSSTENKISITSFVSFFTSAESLTYPSEVNLILLVSRFVRICRTLDGD